MATPNQHNGSDGRAFFTPPGGSAPIEMDVNKWDGTFSGNNKDVSGTVSKRKRIPGVPDASGTASLFYDSANKPTDTTTNTGLNLRPGSIGNLELVPEGSNSGGTNSFRLKAIIDTVKPSSEFDGTISYDVTWSLQDGTTLKYPGDA